MFWIVLLVIAILGSLASGWISIQKSDGRVLVVLETRRAAEAFRELCARGRELLQHERH